MSGNLTHAFRPEFVRQPGFWLAMAAYWLGGAGLYFGFIRSEGWRVALFVPFVVWMIF